MNVNVFLDWAPLVGLLLVALIVNRALLLVPAHEQVVVTRDGVVVDVLEPGINFIRPFRLERTHYDMRLLTFDMGEQVTAADGESLNATVSLQFRIDDVTQVHDSVDDHQTQFVDIVRQELRSLVGREPGDALIDDATRADRSARLADAIERHIAPWGIDVESVEFRTTLR